MKKKLTLTLIITTLFYINTCYAEIIVNSINKIYQNNINNNGLLNLAYNSNHTLKGIYLAINTPFVIIPANIPSNFFNTIHNHNNQFLITIPQQNNAIAIKFNNGTEEGLDIKINSIDDTLLITNITKSLITLSNFTVDRISMAIPNQKIDPNDSIYINPEIHLFVPEKNRQSLISFTCTKNNQIFKYQILVTKINTTNNIIQNQMILTISDKSLVNNFNVDQQPEKITPEYICCIW